MLTIFTELIDLFQFFFPWPLWYLNTPVNLFGTPALSNLRNTFILPPVSADKPQFFHFLHLLNLSQLLSEIMLTPRPAAFMPRNGGSRDSRGLLSRLFGLAHDFQAMLIRLFDGIFNHFNSGEISSSQRSWVSFE